MSDQHENKIDPTISKAFHDIRNTYQSLLYHFDDVTAEGFKVDPEQVIEKINKDLVLMLEAEKTCKACNAGKKL